MDFVKREPGLAAQDTGRTTTANRCRDRWGRGLGASFFSCRPSRGSPKLGQLGTMMNVTGQITKFAAKRQRDAITSRMKDSMSFHTSKV